MQESIFSIIIKLWQTLKLLYDLRMICWVLGLDAVVQSTSKKATRCCCTSSSWCSSRAALSSVKWVFLSCLKKQVTLLYYNFIPMLVKVLFSWWSHFVYCPQLHKREFQHTRNSHYITTSLESYHSYWCRTICPPVLSASSIKNQWWKCKRGSCLEMYAWGLLGVTYMLISFWLNGRNQMEVVIIHISS